MTYFLLDPEVPGEMGPGTLLDNGSHPPKVLHLHFILTNWLGDDLVQTYPCYMVTEDLGKRLLGAGFTGMRLTPLQNEISEDFGLFCPGIPAPVFLWLHIEGSPGENDLGLTDDARLVISERALKIMQAGQLAHCEIQPF